jgi:DNA-directed RNA polymerase specialized sigma24 family protein
MAESPVDLVAVLYGLVLYAQSLSSALVCMGLQEKVVPGGESAEDLAMSTLLKFLDPADSSVTWSEEKGEPTTSKVLAYLRKVLWRDFLDLKKSSRYQKTDYVETNSSEDEEEGTGLTLDQLAATSDSPEQQTIRREQRERVLKYFEEEPQLREILALQLDGEVYNAFSNQELAQLTNATVPEIENQKKQIKLRLSKLAATARREEGHHV